MWHARIRTDEDLDYYGRWVPTGCAALEDAKYYIRVYYRAQGRVIEWLWM